MDKSIGDNKKILLIKRINYLYYKHLHDIYDESHPEVFEGCKIIWEKYFISHPVQRPVKIIDIGCGTGFIYHIIQKLNIPCTSYIGLDYSRHMLNNIKRLKGSIKPICCVADSSQLPLKSECADIITINSALHHFPQYNDVLNSIPSLLKQGGLLIIGHEPNRDFYNSLLCRIVSSIYIRLGLGKKIAPDVVERINTDLISERLIESRLTSEGVIKNVEFNSPTDQSVSGIDPGKGFFIREIDLLLLHRMRRTYTKTYTTFIYRKQLRPFFLVSGLFNLGLRLLFGGGNQLFLVYKSQKYR